MANPSHQRNHLTNGTINTQTFSEHAPHPPANNLLSISCWQLPLVNTVKPFEYKLYLIALNAECRQMAQQWLLCTIDNAHLRMAQLKPPASPQNQPHTQQTRTHLQPLSSNLPLIDAIKPIDYKLLLNELDEACCWMAQ